MNSLSIRGRLVLLILAAASALVIVSVINLLDIRSALYDERHRETEVMVGSAVSIVEDLHQKAVSGEISMEEAKATATNMIGAMRYAQTGYFSVYDSSAVMVNHPIRPDLNGQDLSRLADENGVLIVTDAVNVAVRQGGGFVEYVWPKPNETVAKQKIAYSQHFAPWDWIISTGLYVDDVEEIFWSEARTSMLVVSIVIATLLICSLWVAHSIVKPLDRLKDGILASQKHHDLSIEVELEGKNEISAVAHAFNQLLISLSAAFDAVQTGANSLLADAHSLQKSARQFSETSSEQQDASAAMSAVVEELTVSIDTISGNAGSMRALSHKAGQQSEQTAGSMQQTLSRLGLAASKVETSTSLVTELDAHTSQIQTVISVIRDVAEQTNLLALNAAIEAARAGDQGRGFAVVADEVRLLAERTSQSTIQIAETIEKIQGGTSNVVAQMQSVVESVNDSVSQATQAEETVKALQHSSSDLVSIIDEVSSSLSEQTSANNEMAERVHRIADGAQQNSVSADNASEDITRLYELAKRLDNAASQFKLA
ncbi:methyl-accepting chemotaxis protein [Thaumasiovibrio subtropicus]|uniref:methyl-accepting chemotaxis protein n=1 Tax=Thaumasiovibrio subtropicus TaxID=1891207 RepID=UPI000B35F2B4|nr:methyl-accepting chemotaxis protein [Thaumasiovibrio subtropicus]